MSVAVIPRHASRGLHGAGGERIEAVAAVLLWPRTACIQRVGIGAVPTRELALFHFLNIKQ